MCGTSAEIRGELVEHVAAEGGTVGLGLGAGRGEDADTLPGAHARQQEREGGRRGLEVLRRIREKYADRLVTAEAERGETRTTDEILMDAAKTLNGKLVTNDYNLGKVAAVRGIGVLNLNDLTNALRPAYRAGDRMTVRPLKVGREAGQGVAYLDDGTMVVVDRGAEDLEHDIEVVVTSALQTSAGRMIFARKEEQKL